jgi:hypothetical protein
MISERNFTLHQIDQSIVLPVLGPYMVLGRITETRTIKRKKERKKVNEAGHDFVIVQLLVGCIASQ